MVELGAAPPPSPPPREGPDIREATSRGRVPATAADVALMEARWARGCRRFEAWVGPDLAASCWVSTGSEWIGEVERELRLPTGDCYVWNCVTLPPFRRRGLFRALVVSVVTTAGQEGFARAWIGSVDEAAWTGPALRGAGFRPAARVELLGLAGVGLFHLEPASDADPGAVAAARAGLKTGGWAVQPRRSRPH